MRFLLAALLAGCSAVMLPARPIEPPTETAVALVDQDGQAFCSGTRIAQGILTAGHCTMHGDIRVADASDFNPVTGGYDHSYPVHVIRVDEDHDLALLDDLDGSLRPKAEVASYSPEEGLQVAACGQVYGLPFVVSRGFVAASSRLRIGTLVLIVMDINGGPGDSGSAFFDSHGQIVALWVQGNHDIHLAVPAEVIRAFLMGR